MESAYLSSPLLVKRTKAYGQKGSDFDIIQYSRDFLSTRQGDYMKIGKPSISIRENKIYISLIDYTLNLNMEETSRMKVDSAEIIINAFGVYKRKLKNDTFFPVWIYDLSSTSGCSFEEAPKFKFTDNRNFLIAQSFKDFLDYKVVVIDLKNNLYYEIEITKITENYDFDDLIAIVIDSDRDFKIVVNGEVVEKFTLPHLGEE